MVLTSVIDRLHSQSNLPQGTWLAAGQVQNKDYLFHCLVLFLPECAFFLLTKWFFFKNIKTKLWIIFSDKIFKTIYIQTRNSKHTLTKQKDCVCHFSMSSHRANGTQEIIPKNVPKTVTSHKNPRKYTAIMVTAISDILFTSLHLSWAG